MSAEMRRPICTEMDARHAVLEATQYAQMAGFEETPSRMIATAVSELTRNVLKYAGTGEIRVRQVTSSRGRGIEIEVSDRGPGIADTDVAMSDHFSTGGSLGMGLPGVERMMDEFSLDSAPGKGTRVTAIKWI